MSRRRRGRDIHGVVLLDKPAGYSSNQALQSVRRLFDARKAGHTGSLDPLATGLLPICLGEASKTAGYMLDADKAYRATLRLGEATATGDAEGEITDRQAVPELEPGRIRAAMAAFLGEISQVPPMYSALKVGGRPLYERARRGEVVERKPRRVRIDRLELLDWEAPMMRFEVHCSKGTYVRTLAEDLARELGTCGHLTALRRTRAGVFDPERMLTLEQLEAAARAGRLDQTLLPVDAGLADWPVVTLDVERARRFHHGNPLRSDWGLMGHVRVKDASGRLLGLGDIDSGGRLKPLRVLLLDGPDAPAQ
jgi:tRNA pseudouridine55 synthase